MGGSGGCIGCGGNPRQRASREDREARRGVPVPLGGLSSAGERIQRTVSGRWVDE